VEVAVDLAGAAQPHSEAVRAIYERNLAACGVPQRWIELDASAQVSVVEKGEGPPVLLLHGTGTSSLSLLPLFEHLDGVRAIAVDRPGFGLSDPAPVPRERFRDAAIEFLDQALDALGLERPVLAGNSMGGTWATWYALARPERVRGLVLLGSAPLLPGTRPPALLRLMASPLGGLLDRILKPSEEAVVRLMRAMGEAGAITQYPNLLDAQLAAGDDPVARATNLGELRAVIGPLGFRGEARVYPSELRSVATPSLLIWGDNDPVASVSAGERITGLIPDARLEILHGGHVPYLGNPRRVGELMSETTVSLEGS
jgi:pimeloyl-ACP methyl ester carboxylesterase